MSAYTLQRQLRKRMLAREEGTHDGSLDLLITGCEVSLWLGEQFASDLHLAFPRLSIEVVPTLTPTLTPTPTLTLTLTPTPTPTLTRSSPPTSCSAN